MNYEILKKPLWRVSDFDVPVAIRMLANITGKHLKLRRRMQNNLKMFRVNHLALQKECNGWLRNASLS